MILRSLFLVLFCLFTIVRPVHAKVDPSFVWTTLETPHFLIHYHQGGEEIAQRAAVLAEDIHSRLAPRLRWEPKDRTQLVLIDSTDFANGSAFPIPYNAVTVFLTQPLGEPGVGLSSYDDWLRMVITHEYTHILQLDQTRGGPDLLQYVLGRIYFPNLFQPMWMIEGLATYEETEQTTGGRGRSPATDMVLRMAVLEDAFPDLAQASVVPDFWPGGQVPYLFGEEFTRYLVERYGREKVAEISTTYSGRNAPFLVTSTGTRVLGERYDDLWEEWKASLRSKYGKQAEEVRAGGVTASQQLTRKGFVAIAPSLSPDGTRIAYAVSDADSFPHLSVMNRDGSNDHLLVENLFPFGASGTATSWDPAGKRIYYTKLEVRRNVDLYNDIYWADPDTGKEHRLTRGMRARDPFVSPDGKSVVFVTNRMGKTRLASLELDPKKAYRPDDVVFLTEESANQYATPRISPDGSLIAVSVWQPGGNTDIWLLDRSGAKIAEIASDRAYDFSPVWSSDGKYLYFSSDRSGIFNIYAYDRETKVISQVTNVVGGAAYPAPMPDGKSLVFASYSSKGFDIHAMNIDPAAWKPASAPALHYPEPAYAEKPVETTSAPYSPLGTVYPRFWLPWFGASPASGMLYGAFTLGWDVLQKHQYQVMAFYGPERSRKWYSVDYFYDGLYPTIHLVAVDTDSVYTDLLEDNQAKKTYTEKHRTYGTDVIFPFLKTARQQTITVGYRWQELSSLTDLPPWQNYTGPVPAEGNLSSGRVSYQYNSSRRYERSISPEQGRTVEIGAERFATAIGSDFEFTRYTADWFEYVNMPWLQHHVLAARVFGGIATGDALPQRAFQLGGDLPGDVALGAADTSVHLRGYPPNVLRGQKAVLGTLEYRFPLADLQKGWNTKAIYFRQVHGALFFEAGNAWDETFHHEDVRRSGGGELRFDIDVGYYFPITVRFVVARGFDHGGESQVYLGLWLPLGL
ncbi:MAG: BamA/TamA family outer membrane protein [Nitrospiraceae bacterium]|nr:BamA/TamA family outer membrane protein [Nitrospiraceae bacterium]